MKKYIFPVIILFILYSCQSTGFLMAKAKVTVINEVYSSKGKNENIVYTTNVLPEQYIEFAQITCDDTEDNWC